MATTQADIRAWLLQGKVAGATHMFVVCDTYDYEDYPMFVTKDQDVHQMYKENHGPNMQRIMEVYSYAVDLETQLNEHRSHHFE